MKTISPISSYRKIPCESNDMSLCPEGIRHQPDGAHHCTRELTPKWLRSWLRSALKIKAARAGVKAVWRASTSDAG